ncbi:MAG: metallophosphoesterase [Candidatus Heimdallarchaeota archaeon]
MAGKIYVFGDLHIGSPESHYEIGIEEIRRKEDIDTLILAGDTLELRYGPVEEVFERFYTFRDALQEIGLLKRTILLPGNHDAGIMHKFWQSGLILKAHAWIWCRGNSVLVVHGDGIGLERAIAANQGRRNRNALRLLKQQLLEERPDFFPPLSASDWVVTAHFQIPQNDPHWRVCGISDWTGNPRSGLKRRYAIIDPTAATVERQVTLGIGQLPIS